MPELIAVMNKQAWVGCTCSTLQYPWCGSFCLSERRERVLCCASVRKVDLHLLMQMEFSFDSSCTKSGPFRQVYPSHGLATRINGVLSRTERPYTSLTSTGGVPTPPRCAVGAAQSK